MHHPTTSTSPPPLQHPTTYPATASQAAHPPTTTSTSATPTPEFQCHHADCLRRFVRKTSLTNHLKAHNNHRSRSIYRTKRARMRAAAAMQAVAARAASESNPSSILSPRLYHTANSNATVYATHSLPPRPPTTSAIHTSYPLPLAPASQSHSPVSTAASPPPPIIPELPPLHPTHHPSATEATTQYSRPRFETMPSTLQHLLQPCDLPGRTQSDEAPLSPTSAWPPLPPPTSAGADIAMSFLSPRSYVGPENPAPNFSSLDMLFATDGPMLSTTSSVALGLPTTTSSSLPIAWGTTSSQFSEPFLMMDVPLRETGAPVTRQQAEVTTCAPQDSADCASADETTNAGTPITPGETGISSAGRDESGNMNEHSMHGFCAVKKEVDTEVKEEDTVVEANASGLSRNASLPGGRKNGASVTPVSASGNGQTTEYLDVELLASYEMLPDLTLD